MKCLTVYTSHLKNNTHKIGLFRRTFTDFALLRPNLICMVQYSATDYSHCGIDTFTNIFLISISAESIMILTKWFYGLVDE